MPNEAYYMVGAGRQYTAFITLRDLVVMRTGHSEVIRCSFCSTLQVVVDADNTAKHGRK